MCSSWKMFCVVGMFQHAHAHSSGFFITQDSSFGNLILPVLPRLDAEWRRRNLLPSTEKTSNHMIKTGRQAAFKCVKSHWETLYRRLSGWNRVCFLSQMNVDSSCRGASESPSCNGGFGTEGSRRSDAEKCNDSLMICFCCFQKRFVSKMNYRFIF